MKTKLTIYIISIILILTSCQKEGAIQEIETKTDNLVIFTTDRFMNSGLVESAILKFEEKYECSVLLQSFTESYTLLTHLQNHEINADIVLGILSPHLDSALSTNIFISYEPENSRSITNRNLIMDRRHRLIPYNYDYYAFVYDTDIIQQEPRTLGGLQSSTWDDKIILFDPYFTSIGLGGLEWSLGIFGERGFEQFWTSLKRSVLSISPNWADSYIAFSSGEAPMILGYVTNPLSQLQRDSTSKFKSFIPLEGAFKEIEYAGVVSGSENLFLARRFMDFLLSSDFQSMIPETLWKYPVISGIEMPAVYSSVSIPDRRLTQSINDRKLINNRDWREIWTSIMTAE